MQIVSEMFCLQGIRFCGCLPQQAQTISLGERASEDTNKGPGPVGRKMVES